VHHVMMFKSAYWVCKW